MLRRACALCACVCTCVCVLHCSAIRYHLCVHLLCSGGDTGLAEITSVYVPLALSPSALSPARFLCLSLTVCLSKLDLQQIVVLLVISPHIRCHMGGAEQQWNSSTRHSVSKKLPLPWYSGQFAFPNPFHFSKIFSTLCGRHLFFNSHSECSRAMIEFSIKHWDGTKWVSRLNGNSKPLLLIHQIFQCFQSGCTLKCSEQRVFISWTETQRFSQISDKSNVYLVFKSHHFKCCATLLCSCL